METISNSLFWISNGLLVPVIVLLLLFFLRAIILAGGFFGEFYQRMKLQKQLSEMLETITPENINEQLQNLPQAGKQPLLRCLKKLAEHRDNAAYCERLLANFEVDAEKELGRSRTFIKLGPMLGLMGTLIPMGPALVGLATGDISSMAYNMQVAFATTRGRYGDCRSRRHHSASETTLVCREINDLEYLDKTLRNKTNE